jgi:O-antigen/teichoic acid export membrane protein
LNKIKKIINNLKIPGETLSQKVVKGGFWVFFLKIVNRGFSLIRLIILARILAPSDFGLVGIALLTMSTLETFSQTGFQAALIQKKEVIKSYLNSAWTVLILRGIILFIILYFIAPYAAIFFKAPEAKPIIRVIGFAILFRAFTNIGVIYFQKELEFSKQFIYQFSGTLVDFIVAISAVLILRNVWALVLGLLAGNMVRCFASYLIHPYRPHLSKDLGRAKELFGFGRWILGSSILIFIGAYIDDISVGRLLGSAALGFYQMAYRISNMPATEITYVIASVAFPAYSKIQDCQVRLQQAYFRVMRLTIAISIPIAVGIVLLAPEFTKIFLGEKWIPMVLAMQLLAVAGLIKSVVSTGSPLFTGSGHPNFEFYTQLIRGLIIIIAIYPLTIYMGISGAALCVILSITGMLVIWYPCSQNITKASWCEYANAFWPPLLSSLFMAGSIYLSKLYWNPIQQPLILAVLVFIGVGILGIFVYIAIMYILQRCYPSYNIADETKLICKSLLGK